MPIAQAPRMQIKLAVRSLGDDAGGAGDPRAVRQLDPQLALADIRTLEEIWDGACRACASPSGCIGIFAAFSALLAALGLYGVVSHWCTATARNRHPHGARRALERRPLADRAQRVLMIAGPAVGLPAPPL